MRLGNRAKGVATRASSEGRGHIGTLIVPSGARGTTSVTPAVAPMAIARINVSRWQLGPPG